MGAFNLTASAAGGAANSEYPRSPYPCARSASCRCRTFIGATTPIFSTFYCRRDFILFTVPARLTLVPLGLVLRRELEPERLAGLQWLRKNP